MARPQVADGETASNMEGSCEYIEQIDADSRQGVDLQLGVWAKCYQLLTVKKYRGAKQSKSKPRSWTDTWVQPKQRKRDIIFGTWNVRRLYRSGSLTAAARELARYKLDLAGVQEVWWKREGTVSAGNYNFLYGHLGDTGGDGRIILRWIFRKWDVGYGPDRAVSE